MTENQALPLQNDQQTREKTYVRPRLQHQGKWNTISQVGNLSANPG